MIKMIAIYALASMIAILPMSEPAHAQTTEEVDVGRLIRTVMSGTREKSIKAVNTLVARGNLDVVPSLVIAIRYRGDNNYIEEAMSKLTGAEIKSWKDAMLWQEAHPEVVPHESYLELKLSVLADIDQEFLRFLGHGRGKQRNLDIRLEEITWGGVPVDGIPSLDNPDMIAADNADYLEDDDLVFGVAINGDTRAYPLRIMGWHEMFNDSIGGVPVALAYCTLCGAGILFETQVDGRINPLVFGSSGLLYRSNKLMFDRDTHGLWNQFTGEPVSGSLRGSGVKLKIRPVVTTTWEQWRKKNPTTKVLSINTGFNRDYGSGVVYHQYFASDELMFPTIVRDESQVRRKDFVFGIRNVGAAKAWPINAFEGGRVLNDRLGGRNLVLVGDAESRTVRAFERGEYEFESTARRGYLANTSGNWKITEDALQGPRGERLTRVPGHIAYWFAWDGYLGVDSELYTDSN